MPQTIDLDAISDVLKAASAIEIVPRFGRLAAEDVREKRPNDLVTVADEAMERRLTAELTALLPGSLVVGEEAVAADPSIRDRLAGDGWIWVIDPVDGTANFARGHPLVAVILALVYRGETVAGWVLDPLSGSILTAERGSGTWIDGCPWRMAQPTDLSGQPTIVADRWFPPSLRAELKRRAQALPAGRRPLFCSGQEYLAFARGEVAGLCAYTIYPWDHAAGALAVSEAGGHVANFYGQPYRPSQRSGGLLIAPSANLWRQTADHLLGGLDVSDPF